MKLEFILVPVASVVRDELRLERAIVKLLLRYSLLCFKSLFLLSLGRLTLTGPLSGCLLCPSLCKGPLIVGILPEEELPCLAIITFSAIG